MNISNIEKFEKFNDYEVDRSGNLYSLKSGRRKKLRGSLDGKGYLQYELTGNDGSKAFPKAHRLVALAYIPNIENKPQVNHKDGDKLNNKVDNLEWVTNRENRVHAIENGLKDEIGYGIIQCDLEGNHLRYFDTAREALIYLGKDPNIGGNIGRVIRGKRETAYGYRWVQYEGSTTIPRLLDW